MKIEKLVCKIQEAVSDIRNINSGGCGVFAAMVAKRLNRLGIPAVVRVGAHDADTSNDRLKRALTYPDSISKEYLSNEGVEFYHLIVEFKHGGETYHLDSNQFHKATPITNNYGVRLYDGHLTPLQALQIARSKYWNYQFNRKQIPNMIRKLNEAFNL
jgi:hypothetical protein